MTHKSCLMCFLNRLGHSTHVPGDCFIQASMHNFISIVHCVAGKQLLLANRCVQCLCVFDTIRWVTR